MTPINTLLHGLAFVAPALWLAVGLALAHQVLRWPQRSLRRFCGHALLGTALGVAVLALGLVWGGEDGKMATYLTLVLALASLHAWLGGARA